MIRAPISILLLLSVAPMTNAGEDGSAAEFIAETGVREGPVPARELPGWQPNPTIVVRAGTDLVEALSRDFPEASFVRETGGTDLDLKVAQASVFVGFCTAESVAAANQLVWVQIYSSGSERCLAVDELRRGEVLLTNMQKMSSPAIGEHVIAMALALSHGLVKFGKAMPDGAWRRDFVAAPGMYTLDGKTMLIAGLGGIGSAAAKRASALGMRVIATRNSRRDGPPWVEYVGLATELSELIGEADIVVNALPLTPSTTGVFGKDLFSRMKAGAHFINVGRGRTVVTDDLVDALRTGQIAGAGLDVTDPEPLPADHPLWQMSNVIITPHVSGTGSDRRRHEQLLRENIRRYLAGDALLNVVDPEKGY